MLTFYLFCYWHDRRFKKIPSGPVKIWDLSSNLVKLGHRVFLFVPKIGQPKKQTSARVIEIPFVDWFLVRKLSFNLLAFATSLIYSFKFLPDIFYVRITSAVFPIILAKVFKCPMILEINDDPYGHYEGLRDSPLKLFFVKTINKINFRLSNKIITITEKLKDKLYENDKVPQEKIEVLPSGSNTSLFKPLDKKESQKALGLDQKKQYVCFTGSFYKHQGVDTLIESASTVLEKFPETKFLLVGDGELREEWTKKIIDNGLDNFFIITGYSPYFKVPLYIGAADVCVAPYTYRVITRYEYSPVKIFDYLSCGRPVITTAAAITDDLVKGNCIVFIPPEGPRALAEAIIGLLSNPKKMEEMGKNGRELIVKKYSRQSIAKRIVEIAEETKINKCGVNR